MGYIVFDRSDVELAAWIRENPDGYLLNTHRRKTGADLKYMVLHRSQCRHMNKYTAHNAKPGGFTQNDYIKIGSTDVRSLQLWALKAGQADGSFTSCCTECLRDFHPPRFIAPSVSLDGTIEGEEFVEGAATRITVNRYERDISARKRCIEHHGAKCAVCDLKMEDRYGEPGKDYIEVHHRTPLWQIRESYVVNPITDLVPVCPNCHAMLHRQSPPLSPEALRERLKADKRYSKQGR
ncbi:HNH endonuclease [Roseomonas genomospecies 6]|uniref:HNH domain-containing protein n=1 Tax=Roseomonas genomospecies 6 TaxID=214106 RepID=A0A9W7KRC7_9PROT|nr:HNH endonuclease [Roseomonas genomospecies 6]KAA0677654.1 hypothetical protein DS843_22715 [Roseomonas genomospecies 6]